MLSSRPLVLMALTFAGGIGLAAQSLPLVGAVLAVTLIVAAWFGISRQSRWATLLVGLLFILFGAARYLLSTLVPPTDVSHAAPAYMTLIGTVASETRVMPNPRPGYPASGQFTLNVRAMVRQEDVSSSIPQPGDRGTATGEEIPTQAVSGDVQARVPLASVPQTSGRTTLRGRRNRERQHPAESRDREDSVNDTTREVSGSDLDIPHDGDVLMLRGRLERPVPTRNPGDFDYAAYLKRRGIYATITARRYADWKRVEDRQILQRLQSPVMPVALWLRERVLQHGRRAHEQERGAILNGILLGERGDLPKALREDFERTGTTHVLATAGLHVGMVVVLLLGGLRLAHFAHRPALLTAMALLILYALMAGGRPSVTRAVLMAIVALVGLLLEREPDLPNTIALAALTLLLYNPQNLFEPGFQFSFATVITIVLLMPPVQGYITNAGKNIPAHWPGAAKLRHMFQAISACFFLAIAAQLGAMPLTAYYENSVSLIGIPANTLVVPVIALIIALGFSAALLGGLYPLLAWPLDRILDGLLIWVIGIVRTCSHAPHATLSLPSPPLWLICLYYAAVWSVAWSVTARLPKSIGQAPDDEAAQT